MSFEITFLGASGGPVEGTTCAIMIKPRKVSYRDILTKKLYQHLIVVDAGSGLSQLTETIFNELTTQQPTSKLLNWYLDSLDVSQYTKLKVTMPFKDFGAHTNPFKLAQQIICKMSSYLITHPHLDHIASLVINSAGFSRLNPKNVYGSSYTIDALQRYVFNGIIWPNMPQFGVINMCQKEFGEKWTVGENVREMKKSIQVIRKNSFANGRLNEGLTNDISYNDKCTNRQIPNADNEVSNEHSISTSKHADEPANDISSEPVYSVEMFPLSHGELIKAKKGGPPYPDCSHNGHPHDHYLSSAFLVTQRLDNSSLLIFGDFESDAISNLSNNLRIWKHIAPLIVSPERPLKGIILECSNCDDTSQSELYGHLIPKHLIGELQVLRGLCISLDPSTSQPLKDFPIIVNHVKETVIGASDTDKEFSTKAEASQFPDPRKHVMNQLDELSEEAGLGVKFSMALSGVSIEL